MAEAYKYLCLTTSRLQVVITCNNGNTTIWKCTRLITMVTEVYTAVCKPTILLAYYSQKIFLLASLLCNGYV